MQDKPDWSKFWGAPFPLKLLFWKAYERYRLGAYMRLLKGTDLKGKSIIELGGGSGYLLGLISRRKGAKATVIDNSEEAYAFYRRSGAVLGVKFLKKDMFKHRKKYDVVMSDGLIEHFQERGRAKVLALHGKLMKKGGFCMLFVPKDSWLVRNFFALKEGYEKKFRRDELIAEAESAGLKVIGSASDIHMAGVLCGK